MCNHHLCVPNSLIIPFAANKIVVISKNILQVSNIIFNFVGVNNTKYFAKWKE